MGVGRDAPEKDQAWAEHEGFTFDLWTDDQGVLGETYGAKAAGALGYYGRVTRILGPDGALLVEYDVTNIGTHPEDVLDDCKALFGK